MASKRIGPAIRAHREAEGLSQAAVARQAGIHAAMLSRIERDERSDPYFSTIAKVAAVLGLSLDELAAEAGLPSVRRVRSAASADAVRLDETSRRYPAIYRGLKIGLHEFGTERLI